MCMVGTIHGNWSGDQTDLGHRCEISSSVNGSIGVSKCWRNIFDDEKVIIDEMVNMDCQMMLGKNH